MIAARGESAFRAGEAKPCDLDLDSPIYVDLFCRLVRKALAEHGQEPLTLTEMLPAIEDAWLTDAAGSSYPCELRMAALPWPGSAGRPAPVLSGQGKSPRTVRPRGRRKSPFAAASRISGAGRPASHLLLLRCESRHR
jgi:hypothetical protein